MTALRRLIPLALLLGLLIAVPAAHASKGQEVTFEAPRDLFDPAQREAAFDEIDSLGANALRIVLYWKDVAPDADSRIKPKLDMTDPSVYDWSKYQPVLDEAKQRGWTVQITASGPVPRWATNGAVDNTTRPSPNEFRMFMTALSKHFGGEVNRWSIWNEPNHPDFLGPQYDSKHQPASPKIYRGLYAAALRGLAAAGDTKPVLMGETAPTGTGHDVAPLTFLRGALCLNDQYKKVGNCSKLRVDGYAHHAYTNRSGPLYVPPGPNDVMIGSLSRLTTALDKAAAAGVVKKGLPVYLTEFGIQSTPDPFVGVSLQRQAEYRSYSERIAYYNPRVKAFSQYLLTDDAPLPGDEEQKYSGFESGLRLATGKAKPSLEGFRLPLVAKKSPGSSKVSLWGLARPATGATKVTIQQASNGKTFSTLKTVTTDAQGYWTSTASLGSAKRAWRVKWTDPAGKTYTGPPTRALGK
ncbi:MAG TPA: cellulase family glycosylhydrolase [Baekduia sp.]